MICAFFVVNADFATKVEVNIVHLDLRMAVLHILIL
jgi:hypothetical protein